MSDEDRAPVSEAPATYGDTPADLRAAGAEAKAAREESAKARPPPPSASEIAGEPIKVSLEGDRPTTVRNAARSLSALHRMQQDQIKQVDDALAQRGLSWDDAAALYEPGAGNVPTENIPPTVTETPEQQQAKSAEAERAAQHHQIIQQQLAARQAIDQLDAEAVYLVNTADKLAGDLVKAWPHIRTPQDLERLRASAPNAAAAFDAAAAQIQGLMERAENRQHHRSEVVQAAHNATAAAHDKQFLEKHPEFADPKTARQRQDEAISSLKGIGISDQELEALWSGRDTIHLRDHRVQDFIAEHVEMKLRLAAIDQAKGNARVKDVPPVLRPGVARGSAPSLDQDIRNGWRAIGRVSGERASALAGMKQMQALRRAGKL